jgi:hypothetical protein
MTRSRVPGRWLARGSSALHLRPPGTTERRPKFRASFLFDPHDDETSDFRKYVGMRTMIILATVAFGAMRLMLRTLSPTPQLELAREWTADE